METVAIIISGIAALTSIAALLVSIYHKKSENRHFFYSKLEENISSILFNDFPKALSDFVDEVKRTINSDAYYSLDDCFSNLYSCISCLDYLSDKEYLNIKSTISDLEDALMSLRNFGFVSDKVESAKKKNKQLYLIFKKFSLNH